jgi:hypothetical protein
MLFDGHMTQQLEVRGFNLAPFPLGRKLPGGQPDPFLLDLEPPFLFNINEESYLIFKKDSAVSA